MNETGGCTWPGEDAQYIAYHDTEWGVPKTDDQALFEKIVLEGFQAGLSWITILRKRDHFRKVFDGFNPEKIVRYKSKKIELLMTDTGIIRNRAKIDATISNARAFLDLQEKTSLSAALWDFVDGKPVQNTFKTMKEVPAETETSKAISKFLKKSGFRFVGPTTMYAFMQAVGMVNDHMIDCPRHKACAKLAKSFKAPKA